MKYKIIAPRTQNSALRQVLDNRHIQNQAEFLHASSEHLINPATIKNMKDGAKMLIQHIKNNDYAYLQVDSDCDGFTSSSIMLNYLNDLFPHYAQNKVFIGIHAEKTHGIDIEEIPECVKLVICPDAGSEEFEKHQLLASRGIDVLIIDHHNTPDYSTNALVINDQLGGYPNPDLSGAGMVYKFCSYIDQILGESYADKYLDLASLGIIADVMPLTKCETRFILNQGLSHLNNPFIQYMINKSRYRMKTVDPTPKDFAFSVAPIVNCVCRMGTMEEKRLLFDSMLEFKAYQEVPSTKRGHKTGDTELVVDQAIRISTNVHRHQNDLVTRFCNKLEEKMAIEHLNENKILIFLIEEPTKETKNIGGLVAMKFVSKYGKPTLVLSKTEDEKGVLWSGSGRNPSTPDLPDFQAYLKQTGLVELAAGHDNALGVAIRDDNIQAFIQKSNTDFIGVNFDKVYNVDLMYDAKIPEAIDIYDITSLAAYSSLWGKDIEEPIVLMKNVKVSTSTSQLLGKNSDTIKINIPNTNISLMKFKSSEEEYNKLCPSVFSETTINILGNCKINDWDNSPQLLVLDYEIVCTQDYCF